MGEYKEGYVGGYGSGFTLVVVSFILLITASGAYIGWR
ncbi:YjcZ family sporulation protein [Domibacillus antri]|nr:YjcZ family sporulation protein [Domibacillus antri]